MHFYFYMSISLSWKSSWFMKIRFLELIVPWFLLLLLSLLPMIKFPSLFLILTNIESFPGKVIPLYLLLMWLLLLLPTIIITSSIITIIILISHFLLVYILSIIIHHFHIFIHGITTCWRVSVELTLSDWKVLHTPILFIILIFIRLLLWSFTTFLQITISSFIPVYTTTTTSSLANAAQATFLIKVGCPTA